MEDESSKGGGEYIGGPYVGGTYMYSMQRRIIWWSYHWWRDICSQGGFCGTGRKRGGHVKKGYMEEGICMYCMVEGNTVEERMVEGQKVLFPVTHNPLLERTEEFCM